MSKFHKTFIKYGMKTAICLIDNLISSKIFFFFLSWKRFTLFNEACCAYNQMSGLNLSAQVLWWNAIGSSGHVKLNRAVTAQQRKRAPKYVLLLQGYLFDC